MKRCLFAAFLLLITGVASLAAAHEPVFSLGPETIYEGGVGVESELEFDSGQGGDSLGLNYEILYGVTRDLSLTLRIPQSIDTEEGSARSSGLGDIQLRGKYQLYRRDRLGAQDKVSAILGVKVPSADGNADPPLGTGTTDVLFGLTYGHESRTWYHFATLRYLLRAEDTPVAPGDRLSYDAAIGYRPWRREYLEWDFVWLLELSGEHDFENTSRFPLLPHTDGDTIWLGPTGLLSYRNVMFKGGVQAPVYQGRKGDNNEDDVRAVFAIEYHF